MGRRGNYQVLGYVDGEEGVGCRVADPLAIASASS